MTLWCILLLSLGLLKAVFAQTVAFYEPKNQFDVCYVPRWEESNNGEPPSTDCVTSYSCCINPDNGHTPMEFCHDCLHACVDCLNQGGTDDGIRSGIACANFGVSWCPARKAMASLYSIMPGSTAATRKLIEVESNDELLDTTFEGTVGNTIEDLGDVTACFEAGAADENYSGATWNTDTQVCTLYTGINDVLSGSEYSNYISQEFVIDVVTLEFLDEVALCNTDMTGTYMFGNPFYVFDATSATDCANACEADPYQCKGYSFRSGTCTLQTFEVAEVDMVYTGLSSAVISWFRCTDHVTAIGCEQFHENVSISGSVDDGTNYNVLPDKESASDCDFYCSAKSYCDGWTWDASQSVCYMKVFQGGETVTYYHEDAGTTFTSWYRCDYNTNVYLDQADYPTKKK